MRTTSKLLGVVCAGWVALSLGAPHAGATTSDHPAPQRWSNHESSHQTYTPQHESNDLDLPLLKDWFDGINQHKQSDCRDECNHENDKSWERKDKQDGCNQCDQNDVWNRGGDKRRDGDDNWKHDGDQQRHDGCDSKCDHGGDDWKQGGHKDDGCHQCDQDGKEPVKVVVIVKPFPETGHDGCEAKCDQDRDRNKGDDKWEHNGDNCDPCNHAGDTWNDGGDRWEQGDHGTWDDCRQDECHKSDCDQHDRCDRSDCEHSDCEHSDRGPDDCHPDDCHPDNCPDGGLPGMSVPLIGGLLG
jgi:hypothetical protein